MKHFLMCLLYIAALGVLSFVVGRLIPKHWFHADRFPWVCHPAEQKLWKRLHVRKWQAKIPDMSRIFVKIMPEKKLTKENYENLPRMIEETCVAEWTHILLSMHRIYMKTAMPHCGTAVFLLPFFSSRSIDYANKEWKSICTSNGE